ATIGSRFYHMLLPGILGALFGTVNIVQYLRSEVVDAKSSDYVRTARAKGVPINDIYRHHIFRNSLLPIAAFAGYSITGLLNGAIFTESVFSYPGMGLLFVNSISYRDYTVITALVLLFGILNIFGTLLSDIILSIVDPRIRIE
ncbi:ABC transporter permease, partial [Oenococcus oeni]